MKKTTAIVAAIAAVAITGVGYRVMVPAKSNAPATQTDQKEEKAPKARVEHDEHGADRILISDVKLAAAGAVLAEAGSVTLSDTLSFNGVLRANQEAVVQVTPRFPGIVRAIRKRIGDAVAKDDQLASIESNQSLTVYDLKAPISGTVIDRQISLGEYASEQKPSFVVADLSTIWVDLSIYRQDLKRVRMGDEVLIDPDDGGGDIKGSISYVAPIGSSDTQTALARIVFANREHIMAIEPWGKGLLGTTLRYDYEVRDERDAFKGIPSPRVPKEMVQLAAHILDKKSGHFDPAKFKDEYELALRKLVKRKAAGKTIERAEPTEDRSNVIDLMVALRESVRRGGQKAPVKKKKGKSQGGRRKAS